MLGWGVGDLLQFYRDHKYTFQNVQIFCVVLSVYLEPPPVHLKVFNLPSKHRQREVIR
jgi:hypothetical protein